MLNSSRRQISTGPLGAQTIKTSETSFITPGEMRWLVFAACVLALLVFAPLIWVALRGTENWQFMGVLHNYRDGATYLSKMNIGYEGGWLMRFQHTPEDHAGAFIQVFYLLLGHIARVTTLPMITVFHIARLGAALIMYGALYQFAAIVWARVRTRRNFFVLVVLGSGFGWLFGLLTGSDQYPDFALLPEAFPFFSTMVNVHFPLTIACLALLSGLLIAAMRPGSSHLTVLRSGLPVASLLSLSLAILYPQALVPIGGSLALYTALLVIRRNNMAPRALRWLLAIGLPALPFAIYYAVTVRFNPAMATWNAQNVTLAPDLLTFLLGFALPLLLAIPAIWRAARRFERDGDWLMLLWLVAFLISIYLPTNTQRRFAVGLMIPIAYFATRAVEDVWYRLISPRWRGGAIVLGAAVMAFSPLLVLFIPALPSMTGSPDAAIGIFLEEDYAATFSWMRERTEPEDVVLASPVVSAWVPGWVGSRVVYGHPYETLDAAAKEAAVRAWFASGADCRTLLDTYDVRFVIVGPEELALGDTSCIDSMQLAARTNSVAVYVP
ncbi:MAG: hypothetical protein IPK19_07915 [Chloroflexi bacterium]|nr:hypothetical protein [Chloroflexota bacterium]